MNDTDIIKLIKTAEVGLRNDIIDFYLCLQI